MNQHDAILIFLSSFGGVFLALLATTRFFKTRLERMEDQMQREATVTAREEALKHRQEVETEFHDRREELESRERAVSDRERSIEVRLSEVAELSKDEARTQYLAKVEGEFRQDAERRGREVAYGVTHHVDEKARHAILEAIQRSLTEYLTEASVSVVEISGEDVKGRLIGREGRNIRAFEQTTGVDLIIDDTPGIVSLSSFDPVRRERARLTLIELLKDGRVQPARIEELHEIAGKEIEKGIRLAGTQAAEVAGVNELDHETLDVLGRLKYRASYGQNVLDHSVEVARMAAILADELGFDRERAKRAGLLHDIGKALGPEFEGPHALTGMEFLRSRGESEEILIAVGAHHRDIEPTTSTSLLVISADAFSAARPGARREPLDNFMKRMGNLEQLALSFPGVDRAYAVQAGREVRLMVRPDEIDDLGAVKLANEVATRIEAEFRGPGQVKVIVIRETRATGIARQMSS